MIVHKNANWAQFRFTQVKQKRNVVRIGKVYFMSNSNATLRMNVTDEGINRLPLHGSIQHVTTYACLPPLLQLLYGVLTCATVTGNKHHCRYRSGFSVVKKRRLRSVTHCHQHSLCHFRQLDRCKH